MSEESEQQAIGPSHEPLYTYRKVCSWDCDDVVNWMKGLNEAVSKHISQFQAHGIAGNDLLKLSRQQLEYLKVTKLGHQELLLEAVELLSSVDNSRSRQSTISLSSSLSKKASQLVKSLADLKKAKVDDRSATILDCMEKAAMVLQSSKYLIGWLDRFPTELIDNYRSFRQGILDSSFNLVSSMQSDDFDIPKMTEACSSLLQLTAGMMSPESFSKPDPVAMVTVTLVPDEHKGLGFSIQKTRRGALVISSVHEGSPADRCGQIIEGVELIQINNQNVVYWDVKNVVKCLKGCGHNVVLTLRVSTTRLMDHNSIDGSLENLCDQPQSPPTHSPPVKPKPSHLHLGLERVSSSPALLGDNPSSPSPKLDRRPLPLPSPLTPKVFRNDWEDSIERDTGDEYIRRDSTSGGGGVAPVTSDQLEITSPEAPIKPVIAYRTEIIGGVVHKIPLQSSDSPAGVTPGSPADSPMVKKKNNSLRKKMKPRSSSLSEHSGGSGSGSRNVLATPTSPLTTTPFISPFLGSIGDDKTVFSSITEVVIEGKTTKQVTVSSGPEAQLSRDGILRTSGKKITNPELLVPCFQLKDPDFEGWISKLGGSGFTPKNWRRRWFVLKEDKLYYYKTSFDISALGVVHLSGYTIEQALDLKKKNAFKASKNGARTYYFFTDTAEEMLRWMDVLSKATTLMTHSDLSTSATPTNQCTKQSLESFDDKPPSD